MQGLSSRSPKDSFAGKAAGTLLKRASDFTRFATWLVANKGRPLAAKEPELYAYLSHLRSTGASQGLQVLHAPHWGNEEPWCVL